MKGYWPDAEATSGDIVERFRAKADWLIVMSADSPFGLCRDLAASLIEGADEIERLRARIAEGLEECQAHQWELEKLRGEWGQ